MWWVGRMVRGFATVCALVFALALIAAPVGSAATVQWSGCDVFLAPELAQAVPTAQCGTVAVPVDYADPEGPQAQLAVIRVPASGERIGVLVVNPGGPGGSAVNTVADMGAALADTEIGRRFDLVGVDPRGVGHSTPQLRCRTDEEIDAYRREPLADHSPEGVAHIEQVYGRFVQQCLERMGPEFLAGVGTATAARDLDLVREALGENQISYLGFSYGTALGTAYGEQFPDRVRVMVLDGAIDPLADPIERRVRQLAGFQQAFNAYAADCARSTDCPLGTDPDQWVARYHALIDPLVHQPAWTSDPRGLGYQDAITGTVNALYSQRYWRFLTSGLLGLQRGTDPVDLLLLADEYERRDPSGHYTNQRDASTAITCVDAPYPTDPAAWVEADRRIREAAPFLSYGGFTGFAPRDICALWPVPATTAPHPAVSPGPDKVVVVATTRDPATPYQGGVNLAQQLGAPLITFDGSQHTVVFNGDACVDTAVVRFLVDSVPPPYGLHC
ncbi:tripeptidyl-peptidase B [Mycolicibacterium phlei]|jgi:pimeloyl-ACP methyl ester carboxylesterase|uniref:Hydrolase n=2 Tax=Mycolicibacterium phlei TaxID=1771 RepID=A0A5N5V8V8_MYCPH|nr:Carboxylesterase A precursor [Mycolicibacterium phlei]EID14322.1 tripeptidyl-peptidase B [Mycolicibacterium phlei RIVM601174]KAB7757070.1 hydrolase [Mycolicibacterium phlei DSM 43239 = CCUG 21000]KXW62525.1 hydrolase [Mycolicibacterium phlei DSM 43070]KXW70212.1 hydrolase [Mycolicibacterium phlei DSM 43072]VEG10269.1 tripeptidyl-peptidase B [Mycobacteroides chelonae]